MPVYSCPNCWEVLCICGYRYEGYSQKQRLDIAAAALGVDKKELQEAVANIPRKEESSPKK